MAGVAAERFLVGGAGVKRRAPAHVRGTGFTSIWSRSEL